MQQGYPPQFTPYTSYPYAAPTPTPNPYQQRLQQMEQAMPHLAQQQPQPMPQGLKGRAVTGVEEARAAQIDFDGSLHVFPDVAGGCIYTKQIGLDGRVIFATYAVQPEAAPAAPVDAQAAIAPLMTRIEALETRLNKHEEAVPDGNQPNADPKPATRLKKPDAAAAIAIPE